VANLSETAFYRVKSFIPILHRLFPLRSEKVNHAEASLGDENIMLCNHAWFCYPLDTLEKPLGFV
jgi:hypothetical protein